MQKKKRKKDRQKEIENSRRILPNTEQEIILTVPSRIR